MKSKGFAFIEFVNYKEFQDALKPKNDIIFGKQKLVFNSAKNKYDCDEDAIDIKDNNSINKINIIEENISFNRSDSCETATSTAIISKDSNLSNISNNNVKIPFLGFLGENNKPNENQNYFNNEPNDLLSLQINYTLNKISQQYANRNNDLIKSPLSDYYCNYYLNNDNNNNNKNNNNNNNNNNNSNNKNNNININININKNIINIPEKRNKKIRYNNYYNKFSVVFKNKSYK